MLMMMHRPEFLMTRRPEFLMMRRHCAALRRPENPDRSVPILLLVWFVVIAGYDFSRHYGSVAV
jgi:hypothetical protein